MSIEDFNKLSMRGKAFFLLTRCKLLDTRAIYNKSYVELYILENTYFEVFYDVHTKEVQTIQQVNEENVLKNYFDLRELYLANRQVQPPQK